MHVVWPEVASSYEALGSTGLQSRASGFLPFLPRRGNHWGADHTYAIGADLWTARLSRSTIACHFGRSRFTRAGLDAIHPPPFAPGRRQTWPPRTN